MKANKKAKRKLERRQADYDKMLASKTPYEQLVFKAAYHRPGSFKK